MKKFLVLLFLMTIGISVYAQKSYVTLYVADLTSTNGQYCYLTGDVPSDIQKHYYNVAFGDILNQLSDRGFEVEFMTDISSSSKIQLLLSKKKSSTPPSGQTVSEGDVNKDGEVNISDINRLVDMILGYVREHPEILEQIRK